jgi:hypothetical protein
LVWIPIDIVLTFATVVLAFHMVPASDAVRRSIEVLRAHWPECAWHTLVPPLAVNVGVQILPTGSISEGTRLIVIVFVEMFAVLCKGAAVLFYADRYPIPGMPEARRAPREIG